MFYFYIYKMVHPKTGEFYIGRRKSKVKPIEDTSYRGSSRTWYNSISELDKSILIKEIIDDTPNNQEELNELERRLISENINNPLCKNYHIPGVMFFTKGPLSQDTKNKLSISIKHYRTGKNLSEKTINKIKNSTTGLRWITNGIQNKKIKIEENLLDDGWWVGRTTDKSKGLIWITDGTKNRRIKDLSEIIDGWKVGRTSKSTKGLKRSEETKKKISSSKTGKKRSLFSDTTRKKMGDSKRNLIWVNNGKINKRVSNKIRLNDEWKIGMFKSKNME